MSIEESLNRIAAALEALSNMNAVGSNPAVQVAKEQGPQENGQTPENNLSWDPYTAPLMGRYGKDKQEIMENELTKLGIQFSKSWTGAQMHQELLNHAPKNQSAPPSSEPAKVAELEPAATIDTVKTWAKKVNDVLSPEDLKALLAGFDGAVNISSLKADHYAAFVAKAEQMVTPEPGGNDAGDMFA